MTQYEKTYKEALERAKKWYYAPNADKIPTYANKIIPEIFPELKESEDEKTKREIMEYITHYKDSLDDDEYKTWIAWLEKQGSDTNEIINRDKFMQDVLRGAAINLINWIDYNAAEGNMCLSNMECKDIGDALVSGNWDKIYAYIKKKLVKQGEQKPVWSEEDEVGLGNALWAIGQVKSIAKDENDMGNLWYAKKWLKSIKERMKGE